MQLIARNVFSGLFFMGLTSLSFVACQPQDKALKPAAATANAANSKSASGVNSREDSNKQMLLLLDRVAESMKLFQITLSLLNGQLSLPVKGLEISQTLPTSSIASREIQSGLITWTQKIESEASVATSEQKLQVVVSRDDSGKISQIDFNSVDDLLRRESLAQKKSKENLVLKNANQSFQVKKIGEDLYRVTLKTIDELNQVSGKTLAVSEVRFEASPVSASSVNPPAEANSEWKLTKIKMKQTRAGASSDEFELENPDAKMLIEYSENCFSFLGRFRLNSVALKSDGKPIYSRDFDLGPISSIVQSGPNVTEAQNHLCLDTPFVDIGKLR